MKTIFSKVVQEGDDFCPASSVILREEQASASCMTYRLFINTWKKADKYNFMTTYVGAAYTDKYEAIKACNQLINLFKANM